MRALLARLAATEPARLAELVRSVLVGLVTVGWVTVPDTTENSVVSAVAYLASIALTRFVRGRVTPTAPSTKD